MYQSVKKWIYNIYDGNQMDNLLIISKLVFSDKKEQPEYVLLDNNTYEKSSDCDSIYKKKLEFIELIFLNTSDQINNKYSKYTNSIYDPSLYYQLDGIKFCL